MNIGGTRYISVADTAKLVRVALKQAFPSVKFSVRSSSYSGGASIRVSYNDGPVQRDVEDVVSKFSGSTFDGMIDLKSYHTSELNGEKVSYGADSVHVDRIVSKELMQRALDHVRDRFGPKHVADAKVMMVQGSTHGAYLHTASFEAGRLVHDALREMAG